MTIIGYWEDRRSHNLNGYLFPSDLNERDVDVKYVLCNYEEARCALGECDWEQDNCSVCRDAGTFCGEEA